MRRILYDTQLWLGRRRLDWRLGVRRLGWRRFGWRRLGWRLGWQQLG